MHFKGEMVHFYSQKQGLWETKVLIKIKHNLLLLMGQIKVKIPAVTTNGQLQVNKMFVIFVIGDYKSKFYIYF